MNARDFCFYLKGILATHKDGLTGEQVKEIAEELEATFKEETPTPIGRPKEQMRC